MMFHLVLPYYLVYFIALTFTVLFIILYDGFCYCSLSVSEADTVTEAGDQLFFYLKKYIYSFM